MTKTFSICNVGTIFNPFRGTKEENNNNHTRVRIKFPSRLNAMAIDPGKITNNKNMVFTPGEIIFSIKLFKIVEISKIQLKGKTRVTSNVIKRHSLIKHAAKLMRNTLGIEDGLNINFGGDPEIPHSGLGSSSAIIAATATAINELYGNPISPSDLVRFLAQNHVEEIDNEPDLVQQVQCIGGSAASGLFEGGLLILAGESQVIKTMDIDPDYRVVIGIPNDYVSLDSKTLMEKEENNFKGFNETSRKFRGEIAYRVLHNVLPAMNLNDLDTVGDLIFDYRFNMGSIKNCSFIYPNILRVSKNLSFLKKDGIANVLSISSVGPSFFAITKRVEECLSVFNKFQLNTFTTNINNNKYEVLYLR